VLAPSLPNAVLIVFGLGFLVADARIVLQYLEYLKRRGRALLVWPSPRPQYYALQIGIGVVLGLLLAYKLVGLHQRQVFGELMMFLYYGCLLPLSRQIGRGFYEDGIWADAFIAYPEIGGISWREEEHRITLVVISRLRNLARLLVVPGDKYGAARRLLRDKIAQHDIQFSGTGLDLGGHDEREGV